MDSFQGCYKNGTEPGTRDRRWFASAVFLIRYILLIISVFAIGDMYFTLSSIVLILTSILLLLLQPFKPELRHHSNIIAMYFIFIALFYVSISGMVFAATICWGGGGGGSTCRSTVHVPPSPLRVYHHISVDNCT